MKQGFLNDGVVNLRAIEPEDLELLYTIENDSELWDRGTVMIPYSRYSLRRFIQNTQNDLYVDRQLRLMICLSDGNETVGIVDLFNFEPHHSRAEIGITLLASYRGRGIALRAVNLLCEYAFNVFHLHSLSAWVTEENDRSRLLFDTAGFEVRGVLNDWLMTSDGFRNVLIYQKKLNK